VHTFAKARFTGVAIWIRIPDRHRNLIITGPLPTFPENFMQSVRKFLRKVANRQTDRQTTTKTSSLAEVTTDKNSSGDEIANVNFYAVRPGSYPNSLK